MSVSTKEQQIAELAKRKPDAVLTTLAHHIDYEWLREAYHRTRKDGATGIDKQTTAGYSENLEENLKTLLGRLKTGRYYAPPVRRCYIPKGNKKGDVRPIGIPTFEDKILQRAVHMALEPVYEQEYHDCSYGFRPKRSAHQAIEAIWQTIMGMKDCWVLEVDIRKYFEKISHAHFRKFIKQRVNDGVIIRTIGKWLNAGVMEDGAISYADEGVPQGGVISPLISNIYLHEVLDKWFEQEIKPRLSGSARLIRFADDFLILFENQKDAERVYAVLPKRFSRYGLTLHPEKTRLVHFNKPEQGKRKGETFNFLGFTHYWGESRGGKWVVKRKTAKDRLKRAIRKVYTWCKENRHMAIKLQRKKLCQKLHGHYGYYGITFNSRSLQLFYEAVMKAWQKWLNRRSRKAEMPWERFNILLQLLPLTEPRIVHSYMRAKP